MSGLYNARWRKARIAFLAENPLCARCNREGRLAAATVVDHVKPHKGDMALFWDAANWEASCKPCHDRAKQSEEKGGTKHLAACGPDGLPLHPAHPWNR